MSISAPVNLSSLRGHWPAFSGCQQFGKRGTSHRLGHMLVKPRFHRTPNVRFPAPTCHGGYQNVLAPWLLPNLTIRFVAVHVRHTEVKEDCIWFEHRSCANGADPIVRDIDSVTHRFQKPRKAICYLNLIV